MLQLLLNHKAQLKPREILSLPLTVNQGLFLILCQLKDSGIREDVDVGSPVGGGL